MTRRSETVSLGTQNLGSIEETSAGFETFGPHGAHLKTAVTIQDARRALFELHRDSQAGLLAEVKGHSRSLGASAEGAR